MWRLSKPIACPKPSQTRLMSAEKARKEDERKLEQWRRLVRLRDGHACRCCGRRVVQSLSLRANRAECHHIVGRAHKATRFDVRNGLLLCLKCHNAIEGYDIHVTGTVAFLISGVPYVNADHECKFT